MKKILYIFAALLGTAMLAACDDDYNAPVALRSSFSEMYPTAVDVEWEKRHGYAIAEFRIPGEGECEAWYKDEVWVGTKYDIKYNDLPSAVQMAFESEYGAETPVDDVDRLERPNKETIYFIEAEIYVNGYIADIYLDYNVDGELLRTAVDIEDYNNIYYYI